MMLAFVFPERLPLKKARAVSVVHTAAHLARFTDTTLILPADSSSKKEIEDFYQVDLSHLNLLYLKNQICGIKSNKIFNYFLLKKLSFFDIFYVRHLKTAAFLIKKRLPRQKVIFEAHEVFSESMKEEAPHKTGKIKKLQVLEAFVYQNVDGLTFTSFTLKKFFEKRFMLCSIPKKVVYHGTAFQNLSFVKKDFSKITKIYYCGNFYKWKGLEVAIKALSKISSKMKFLVIGGEEKRARELLAFAERCGVKERVVFSPFKPQKEVLRILVEEARLTLIPNAKSVHNFFSFPIKMLEYMITSNIVIAADTPVVKEIVKDGVNGFLFKTGNSTSLAEIIEKVLNSSEKVLSKIANNAYKTAKELTYEKRAKEIFEFLKEIYKHQ